MTINIELKPLEIPVEIPDFGTFFVRRMGAATEAVLQEQLSDVQKKMDDLKRNNAELFSKEAKLIADENLQALEELRATVEYQAASEIQKTVDGLLQHTIQSMNKAIMDCWRSEMDGAVEKLFSTLSMAQIKSAYNQIMTEADNA